MTTKNSTTKTIMMERERSVVFNMRNSCICNLRCCVVVVMLFVTHYRYRSVLFDLSASANALAPVSVILLLPRLL